MHPLFWWNLQRTETSTSESVSKLKRTGRSVVCSCSMLLTFMAHWCNTNCFMSVCFHNTSTTTSSFCENESVHTPLKNKRLQERRWKITSWEETGRQFQGDYAPQWHKQNENSQSWCQTSSNFCRLKSSLLPKGKCRGGIFCGTRSSLCQRYPLGPATLQTNWSVLCQVQLTTVNQKRDHCGVMVFTYELQHTQTWHQMPHCWEHLFAVCENISSPYHFRHLCTILVLPISHS